MASSADDGCAPDGSPVPVYRRLPPAGEAEIVDSAIPAASTILELGCGTGRISERLVELGHRVIGVDESAEMLASLRHAHGVHSRIEDLDLRSTFAVVLLPSWLVNIADHGARQVMLRTARRHLSAGGTLLVERLTPEWIDTAVEGERNLAGGVRIELHAVKRRGEQLSATARFSVDGRFWEQAFTVQRLDEQQLRAELLRAGLAFDGWRSDDTTWFAARRATVPAH